MHNVRPHVVVLAPYIDAGDVGESWSAHCWVSGLSQRFQVTVLCQRRRGQAPIAPSLPDARVVEWQDPPLLRSFERFDSMLKPGWCAYYIRARRWLKHSLAAGLQIDLIHQLSPLALRYPCPAVGLGIPYIIGPLGGSLATPAVLAAELPRSKWFMRLRALDHFRLRYDPMLRRSYAGAACVIGVAPYVADLLTDIPLQRFAITSETAVREPLPAYAPRLDHQGLRLLYVGRVVRTKGLRDAIRAMAMLRDPSITLDVVGTGDDLDACVVEARSLGVPVRFHGRQSRADVDRHYEHADAFLFPSFREPSGNVVLEAMSHGLPIITADRGGPGHVVTPECGIAVPVNNPDQFASQIAESILRLRDPALRQRMGIASRARILERHTWGTQIAFMGNLYESIIDASHPRRMAETPASANPRDRLGRRTLDPVDAATQRICRT